MTTYTKFTGKSATVTFNVVAAVGVQSIEVTENAKPLVDRIDTTDAGDSAYEFTDDPLGGKGTPKTTVRVTAFANGCEVTDVTNDWVSLGGSTHALVVSPKSGATNSKFTVTNAYLETIETTIPVRAFATRVYTFNANEAGTWGTT